MSYDGARCGAASPVILVFFIVFLFFLLLLLVLDVLGSGHLFAQRGRRTS